MEFEFCTPDIYRRFEKEYNEILEKFSPQIKKEYWSSFIFNKDLGIKVVKPYTHTYKVVDEKKWFLSKIRYGI